MVKGYEGYKPPFEYRCKHCRNNGIRLYTSSSYEPIKTNELLCTVCLLELHGSNGTFKPKDPVLFGPFFAAVPKDNTYLWRFMEMPQTAIDWWLEQPVYTKPEYTRVPRKFKKKVKRAIVYHHGVIYSAPNPVLTKDIRVKRSAYGLRFKWLKYQDKDVQTRDAAERDRYGFAAGIVREVAYHKYATRIRKYLRSITSLPPMAREYLPNLAGVPAETANPIVIEELSQAGIDIVDMPAMGEVKATKYGMLFAGNYTIAFHRNWVYWVAAVADAPNKNQRPALSVTQARQLNDSPGTGDGTKYSGNLKKLGGVVRADGYAGGCETDEIEWPVSNWHIDSPAGLILFARWCRNNLARVPQSPLDLSVVKTVDVHVAPVGHLGKLKKDVLTVLECKERNGMTVYRVKLSEGEPFDMSTEQLAEIVRGGEFVTAEPWMIHGDAA